jgi:hypothetical protein
VASASNIVLAATAVSFANEWYQENQASSGLDPFAGINIRIPVAGGLLAILMAGLSRVNEEFATGLATIMFVTVLATPFHGKSPLETLASMVVAKPKRG